MLKFQKEGKIDDKIEAIETKKVLKIPF